MRLGQKLFAFFLGEGHAARLVPGQHPTREKNARATMPMARAACVCPIAAVLTTPATAAIAMTAKSDPYTQCLPSNEPPAPDGLFLAPVTAPRCAPTTGASYVSRLTLFRRCDPHHSP